MCLGEKETYITLVDLLLYRQRLFWPSMVKDCIEYAMSRVPKAWQYLAFASVGATYYSKTLAFSRSST